MISGHRDPSAPSDHAPLLIGATRQYLVDFDEALRAGDIAGDVVATMSTTHPDLGNPYTLVASADGQFPTT